MDTTIEKKVVSDEETRVGQAPAQAKKAAPAAVKTAVKASTSGKKGGLWKSVLVGGVPGIIFGAAGTIATEDVAAAADSSVEDVVESAGGAAPVHDVAPVATGVTDEMSFSEAFATARAEVGPGGAFSWHGQVYGTYNKAEWDELSDEQKGEYTESVSEAHVEPEPYEPQPEDPEIVEETPAEEADAAAADLGKDAVEEEAAPAEEAAPEEDAPAEEATPEEDAETPAVEQEDDVFEEAAPEEDVVVEEVSGEEVEIVNEEMSEEMEVEIIGMSHVETEDGSIQDVGIGLIGGHDAAFLDLEGDGEVDTILIDDNDNGEIEENEVYDASGSGISISEFETPEADYGEDNGDDGLFDGMPDYTNDADASSLI